MLILTMTSGHSVFSLANVGVTTTVSKFALMSVRHTSSKAFASYKCAWHSTPQTSLTVTHSHISCSHHNRNRGIWYLWLTARSFCKNATCGLEACELPHRPPSLLVVSSTTHAASMASSTYLKSSVYKKRSSALKVATSQSLTKTSFDKDSRMLPVNCFSKTSERAHNICEWALTISLSTTKVTSLNLPLSSNDTSSVPIVAVGTLTGGISLQQSYPVSVRTSNSNLAVKASATTHSDCNNSWWLKPKIPILLGCRGPVCTSGPKAQPKVWVPGWHSSPTSPHCTKSPLLFLMETL
mmetsp:Transcript_83020/g.231766  ORF Transcript_83020/g.231766 Transcript_83020/m.231766 type:complete len:296 (+) Transcript_83020:174-1061(+)